MVHGINADETWFNDFSTPFSNAKVLFKAIHFNAKQRISHGGALVSTQIFTAANQFGDGPITSIQPFTNSQPYPGNDYVVTVPSAMYTEDQFQTVTPTLFVNHHTIGSQQIDSMIMNKIIAGLQTWQ